MKVRAYTRVSSKSQLDKEGLMLQKTALKQHCETNYPDSELVWYEERGISGTTQPEQRPAMAQMLLDVCIGDVVLSREVSRISRVVLQGATLLHQFRNNGVVLSCLNAIDATESSQNAFVYHIMLAAAENEIALLKERSSLGMEEVRKKGGDMGGRPKPWQTRDEKTKELMDCPEKISQLLEIKRLMADNLPNKEIASLTGLSAPTISRHIKQLSDTESEMSKRLNHEKDD